MAIRPFHILDFNRARLLEWAAKANMPSYRADQVLEWVHKHRATDWADCSNLSKLMRTQLADTFDIFRSRIVADPLSHDGTRKLLLEFPGTEQDPRPARIECVMIPDEDRRTACISTQAGCPVACKFCASGIDGLQRNLTAGEIVEQIQRLRQYIGAEEDLTNVVVMGMGEPLANYANLVGALKILNAPWGGGIGARRFTVSTVGLPSRMSELAREGIQLTLAISLHAPTEELRKELIPWARSVDIPDILAAAKDYFDQTGREVTFEYILLADVNDSVDQAAELANLAKSVRANVNLIPYNPVPGLPYKMPESSSVVRFENVLRRFGVNTHVRRRRGSDIDAACGQLRRVRENHPETPVATIPLPMAPAQAVAADHA